MPQDSSFYFVHSYYTVPDASVPVLGTTDHGLRFVVGFAQRHSGYLAVPPRKVGRGRAAAGRQLFEVEAPGVLQKRVIVCLDVKEGTHHQGRSFRTTSIWATPSRWPRAYYRQGVDELVFYDITASAEKRGIMIDVVRRVARAHLHSLLRGRRLATADDIKAVILAGAEKVSLNSQAVQNPDLIRQGAAMSRQPEHGARHGRAARPNPALGLPRRHQRRPDTHRPRRSGLGLAAVELGCWARSYSTASTPTAPKRVTSCQLTKLLSEARCPYPSWWASGGAAATPEHLREVLRRRQGADAALIDSMVHYGTYGLSAIKDYLSEVSRQRYAGEGLSACGRAGSSRPARCRRSDAGQTRVVGLTRLDGAWFLTAPDSGPFLSRGVDVVLPASTPPPNRERCATTDSKGGVSLDQWAKTTAEQLASWNARHGSQLVTFGYGWKRAAHRRNPGGPHCAE